MATGDRKNKILEHLAQSTNGMRYDLSKKRAKPSIPPTPPKPVERPTPSPLVESSTSTPAISTYSFTPLTIKDRKRRIMNHVKSSSGDFGDFSLNPEQRKRQIIEHVRKSLK
ncbi:hypothetical protein IQ238_14795 [Pleurocapsales cyanobacterium LEGE 06147]|nr:hypothetical protein [Pleurocapsales cyanobacterium LEGE 06147]